MREGNLQNLLTRQPKHDLNSFFERFNYVTSSGYADYSQAHLRRLCQVEEIV